MNSKHEHGRASREEVKALKLELVHIRQQSLLATRRGDFMRVARLTSQASQVNHAIAEKEGILLGHDLGML